MKEPWVIYFAMSEVKALRLLVLKSNTSFPLPCFLSYIMSQSFLTFTLQRYQIVEQKKRQFFEITTLKYQKLKLHATRNIKFSLRV